MKKTIAIGCVSLVTICLAVGTWLYVTKNTTPLPLPTTEYGTLTKQIIAADRSTESARKIFDETYRRKNDDVYRDVTASDVTKWDQAMVEKAYFSLIYFYRVAAYQSAAPVLQKLDAAAAAGIDTTTTTLGIDEDYLSSLRKTVEPYRRQQQPYALEEPAS